MTIISGNQYQEMNKEKLRLQIARMTQSHESTGLTKNTYCRMTSSELTRIAPLPSEFLSLANPDMQITVLRRFDSLEKILCNEHIPTLALVSHTYGPEIATEWIYLQMCHFFDSCEQLPGVKEPVTREFAQLILLLHPNLNLYEFCYFLAGCRVGRYGQFYGVSGPNQLAAMLNQYLKEDKPNAQYNIEIEKQRKRREEEINCTDGYKQYIDKLKAEAAVGSIEATKILQKH